ALAAIKRVLVRVLAVLGERLVLVDLTGPLEPDHLPVPLIEEPPDHVVDPAGRNVVRFAVDPIRGGSRAEAAALRFRVGARHVEFFRFSVLAADRAGRDEADLLEAQARPAV